MTEERAQYRVTYPDGSVPDDLVVGALDKCGLVALEIWGRAPESLRQAARRLAFDGADPRDIAELLVLAAHPHPVEPDL